MKQGQKKNKNIYVFYQETRKHNSLVQVDPQKTFVGA